LQRGEAPIHDRAEHHAGEATHVTRRGFLQAQRLPHRAREGHQDAEATSVRAARQRQRVAQIAGPVGVRRIRTAQGAGDDHGHCAVVCQLEPERRFLHGVGSVGDDHPVGSTVLAGREH
jgi:hypothetical protein